MTERVRHCREVLRDDLAYSPFWSFCGIEVILSMFSTAVTDRKYNLDVTPYQNLRISRVWPSMLSVYYRIVLASLLEFISTVGSVVTHSCWPLSLMEGNKAPPLFGILKGSLMHHPLLFLKQHPSSQCSWKSRFPSELIGRRLTMWVFLCTITCRCVCIAVCLCSCEMQCCAVEVCVIMWLNECRS